MRLSHDRRVTISVGNSRKAVNWQRQETGIGELWDRLRSPMRGTETVAQYLAYPKSRQDELKDVGGFVAGVIDGPRRRASAVTGRDIVTLDFDTIPPYKTDTVIQAAESLRCAYAAYSTRKHRPEAPRLRLLFPLDRTVSVDEYEPIARRLAEKIGIQMADPTTFEPSRLMYWPSCCADSDYVFKYADALLLNADSVLKTYADWHDYTSWPQVPGSGDTYRKLAARQGDPDTKPGIVGAFNRAYGDVLTAIEKLLPGIYAPVDKDPNRLTYLGGSTTGGAVVYDSGKFLYSHHATDPCSGKLVNCFDLVRLHKFGDRDDGAQPGTPSNRLPSFKAMCDFASEDALCKKQLAREVISAAEDFKEIADSDELWSEALDLNTKGLPKPTIRNILLILEHDAELVGKFAYNEFAGMCEVLGPLPWNREGKRRLWSDTDTNGLYWFLEQISESRRYGITSRPNIDAALDIYAQKHAFNDVQDYLQGLDWDGKARLDTLFIDYLGAEDDKAGYVRAVTRKSFTAAVARAMTPGCKFDNMLILSGPQGIGKSSILDRMSRGWFNDSIRTFEGKETAELLPGAWLVEVAELDAFRKSDVTRIKQFLSLRADRYRAAYGRNVKEQPRSCVFFGTCNQMEYLTDASGNRRFWPVDVGREPAKRNVWNDLTGEEIDQIWAEAKVRWQMGEQLFLTGSMEAAAKEYQELHRDVSAKEGMIQSFLDRPVPDNWLQWGLDRRRDFWSSDGKGDYNLVPRDRISVIEVWCELFLNRASDIKKTDKDEIKMCIMNTPGWKQERNPFYGGVPYGTQRGFVRVPEKRR